MAPAKPGLQSLATEQGTAVELEICACHLKASAPSSPGYRRRFVSDIQLEDGRRVQGFLCEHHAALQARDISTFGGWRPYRRFLASTP